VTPKSFTPYAAQETPVMSYWAASSQHTEAHAPLDGDRDVDVIVVGAGFTGLSAAHHLQQAGLKCLVLEACEVGWGASGRNGGMVVPRYKFTFPELETRYGAESAVSMYHLAHAAVDTLERIIDSSRLICGFSRCGHLTPIAKANDVRRFEADIDWLARRVTDHAPALLGHDESVARIGTDFYQAAYFEPRGGGIHPLDYCRALARSLAERGVEICTRTPVLSWQSESAGVTVQTRRGRARSRELVLAMNGYSDMTRAGVDLKKRIVPVASALIATRPLSTQQRAAILPKHNVATDAKRLTNYYRLMPDGRFVFGGRGGATSQAGQEVYRRLAADMASIFPGLAGVPIEYRWYGMVAVTLDGLPHIGTLKPRVSYAMGYNGRGVALSALMGAELSRMILGTPGHLGPLSHAAFGMIPFHALRVPAKQLAIRYYQLKDALGL
jgi:gamma-glutamylputrescine oxidase